MKIRSITKLDKKNKTTFKKINHYIMSINCNVIFIFLIYDQSGVIWKTVSARIVCKTYIFIKSNLLCYKNWKQNEEISHAALTLLVWVTVLFLPNNADSFQKKCWHKENQEGLGTKRYVFWNYICVSTYIPIWSF